MKREKSWPRKQQRASQSPILNTWSGITKTSITKQVANDIEVARNLNGIIARKAAANSRRNALSSKLNGMPHARRRPAPSATTLARTIGQTTGNAPPAQQKGAHRKAEQLQRSASVKALPASKPHTQTANRQQGRRRDSRQYLLARHASAQIGPASPIDKARRRQGNVLRGNRLRTRRTGDPSSSGSKPALASALAARFKQAQVRDRLQTARANKSAELPNRADPRLSSTATPDGRTRLHASYRPGRSFWFSSSP